MWTDVAAMSYFSIIINSSAVLFILQFILSSLFISVIVRLPCKYALTAPFSVVENLFIFSFSFINYTFVNIDLLILFGRVSSVTIKNHFFLLFLLLTSFVIKLIFLITTLVI